MSKTYIYIVLEFILSVVLSILSAYLFSLFDNNSSLNDGIFYGLLILYGSSLSGVWLIGYLHLKKAKRLKDLVSAIILSILGLIAFLTISIAIDYSGSILLIILPIAGAVLGFNSTNLIFQKTK